MADKSMRSEASCLPQGPGRDPRLSTLGLFH
jgi:hypothetical protein